MATRKPKNYRRVARVAIQGPGRMTKRGRRDVAVWLRRLADSIVKRGEQYTEGRFTASFGYRS